MPTSGNSYNSELREGLNQTPAGLVYCVRVGNQLRCSLFNGATTTEDGGMTTDRDDETPDPVPDDLGPGGDAVSPDNFPVPNGTPTVQRDPVNLEVSIIESFSLSSGDQRGSGDLITGALGTYAQQRLTGISWTAPDAAKLSDGAFATVALDTSYSKQLVVQDFGFDVPPTATVVGFEVVFDASETSVNGITHEQVGLVSGGYVQSEYGICGTDEGDFKYIFATETYDPIGSVFNGNTMYASNGEYAVGVNTASVRFSKYSFTTEAIEIGGVIHDPATLGEVGPGAANNDDTIFFIANIHTNYTGAVYLMDFASLSVSVRSLTLGGGNPVFIQNQVFAGDNKAFYISASYDGSEWDSDTYSFSFVTHATTAATSIGQHDSFATMAGPDHAYLVGGYDYTDGSDPDLLSIYKYTYASGITTVGVISEAINYSPNSGVSSPTDGYIGDPSGAGVLTINFATDTDSSSGTDLASFSVSSSPGHL